MIKSPTAMNLNFDIKHKMQIQKETPENYNLIEIKNCP